MANQVNLDELAVKWSQMSGEDPNKQGLYIKIWGEVYNEDSAFWQDQPIDAIGKLLERFKIEKGQFTHYLHKTMKYLRLDAQKKRTKKTNTEVSIDDEESNAEPLRACESEVSLAMELQDSLLELATVIQNFGKNPAARSENKECKMWYDLFYTEMITRGSKTEPKLLHCIERDIFQAMELPYLDYYMKEVCRGVEKLCDTPLKSEREVIDSSFTAKSELSDAELEINDNVSKSALPAAVPLSYLKRARGIVSRNSTHSKYYRKYQEMTGQYRP